MLNLAATMDAHVSSAWTNATMMAWEHKTDPNHFRMLLVRAQIAAQRSDHAETIRLASRAAETVPADLMYFVHYVIGVSHCALAEVSSLDFMRKRARGGFEISEFRRSFRTCPDGVAALRSLQKATELKPDFSPAWAELADFHIRAGQWPEGLLAAESLVRLVPRCAAAYETRALCFKELD